MSGFEARRQRQQKLSAHCSNFFAFFFCPCGVSICGIGHGLCGVTDFGFYWLCDFGTLDPGVVCWVSGFIACPFFVLCCDHWPIMCIEDTDVSEPADKSVE